MQMSLAQALKEKNRIVGEIAILWSTVQKENSVLEGHKRTIDVEEAMQTIDHYTAKLIELKTKIGQANGGNLKNIYALAETKSKLSKLNELNGNEDSDYRYRNGTEYEVERTAVYNETALIAMRRKLQLMCNELQDKIDEYNAINKISFDSPLR